MAQFSVYRNLKDARNPHIPYLLDVQSELLESLDTRVVVPLVRSELVKRGVGRLQPEFNVAGERVVMETASLGAVPAQRLGPPIADLRGKRTEITAALDCLLTGI